MSNHPTGAPVPGAAMKALLAAAMAATAFAATHGCIVDERCSGDAECGSGKICVEDTCVTGCRLSRDCSTGEICEANECVPGGADGDGDADLDCDGEVSCPDDMVAGCGACIDIYEASRDDATADSSGTNDVGPATSRAGVMPWTNMSREVARAACERAGKRLCRHDEWITACRGPVDTAYPYGDGYEPETCNGIDTYGRGNQRLLPTGSMPDCTNEIGAFDLSGNVWEIDENVPGWVHGGAYNCIDSESLHLCSYNQDFGTDPGSNVGFRCCRNGD